jgi:transposase
MMMTVPNHIGRNPERDSTLNLIPANNVIIVCGRTDMRLGIDGLASIVQQSFNLDPCSRGLFLFCGRRNDRIKALYYEGDGFVLLYKRLEGGRFQWPRRGSEARLITRQQLRWLLEGLSVDQPKALVPIGSKIMV